MSSRMENDYGIGITNRYLMFLDNEDDPHETLKISETADKDQKKKVVKSGAEKENRLIKDADQKPTVKSGLKGIRDSNDKTTSKGNTGAAAGDQMNRNNRQNVVPRGGGGKEVQEGRNNKGFGEPLAKKRDSEDRYNNRRNRDDVGRDEGRLDQDFGRFNDGPRRGGGGRQDSGMRGGNRNAPGGNRDRGDRPPRDGAFSSRGGGMRKREFDRQSGSDKSGVKPVDKRDGGGSRNWGTFKDDIDHLNAAEDSMEERADKDEPRENGPSENDTQGCDKKEGEIDEEKEAEKKEMTLDQWKALQAGSRQKPIYNTRKAGEGEDMSQWSKLTLKKKEKEEGSEEEEEEGETEVHQRTGKQKKVIELNFKFNDSPGGRGKSDRGGGGRGFRGGNEQRDRDRGGDRDRDRRGGGGGGGGERDRDRADRRGGGGGGGERDRGGDRDRGGYEGGRGGERGGFNERGGGGGGRYGDRDRDARGGGRGGGRDKPVKQAAPNYDDVNDFPSLG